MNTRWKSCAALAACAVWLSAMAEEEQKPEPELSETHVVEGGDTLWDLCQRYLKSPWYWPKVWSYNPQITNAHWIFPGNEIRFYPSDESLPTEVNVARNLEVPEEEAELLPLVKTVGTIRVGRIAPRSFTGTHVGIVSTEERAAAAKIARAFSEQAMLSDYDRVYVENGESLPQDQPLAVYRVVGSLEHPVSGDDLGYAVEVVGAAAVVRPGPSATIEIQKTFRPIERGHLVGPWPASLGQRVTRVKNEQALSGHIVRSVGDVVGMLGEHMMVYIDRGTADGVRAGNTFSVVMSGDEFLADADGLPEEDVGEVMVIDAKPHASTAVVTYAVRELAAGDRLEMRL